MLVVLEGIDGAGKSRTAAELAKLLAADGAPARHRSKSAADFGDPAIDAELEELRNLIWRPGTAEPAVDRLGARYYAHLIAAWFSVLERSCLVTTLDGPGVTIFDGWYYRTIAKAMIREHLPEDWLWSLFAAVSTPDLVVVLDVDPSVAWHRREGFKPSELGRWDGFEDDDERSFCRYQKGVRDVLLGFASMHGWKVVAPAPSESIADVAAQVAVRVRALRPPREVLTGAS